MRWNNDLLCRPLLQLQPDSWLLSRLSPNTRVQTSTTPTASTNPHSLLETETDSGLDSLEESDKNISGEKREKLLGVDEMQVEQSPSSSYSQSLFCVSFISEGSVNLSILFKHQQLSMKFLINNFMIILERTIRNIFLRKKFRPCSTNRSDTLFNVIDR